MGGRSRGGCIIGSPRHATQYRLIYVDGKQRLEHRVVMERELGRPLLRSEVVHHKDENGLNNAPGNLQVMTQAEHRRLHGGPRTWSLEEAIRLRFEEELTMAAVGERLGVNWTQVLKAFRVRGLDTADRRHGVYSWPVTDAAARIAKGESQRSVARSCGISLTAMRKTLRKLGHLPAAA